MLFVWRLISYRNKLIGLHSDFLIQAYLNSFPGSGFVQLNMCLSESDNLYLVICMDNLANLNVL
jgi:hypothetical protein